MNVLATLIRQTHISLATKAIIEELKPKKFILVCSDDTNEGFENMPGFVERYNQGHSLSKTYHGKMHYDDMIEIDKDLADAFAPYFETAIQLYARQANCVDLITYDELSFMVYEALAYWNTVLEKNKIDVYMAFNIPHGGYDYVIYALCKIKKISTYFMVYTQVPNYCHIVEDIYNPVPEFEDVFKQLKLDYKNRDIEDITLPKDFLTIYNKFSENKEDLTPGYMNPNFLPEGVNRIVVNDIKKKSKIRVLYEIYKKDGLKKMMYRMFFRLSHFFYGGIDDLTKEYNSIWDRYAQKADFEKKYLYLPLHLQPEFTTCPISGVFMHQELMVHMLSKVVPDDVLIYVKENPKQLAYGRFMKFPQKLSEYRNVVLVERNTDTFKLSDGCIATVSATGTVLWEGVFKRKPGIMFGNYISKYVPGIISVKNKKECEIALNEILNDEVEIQLKDIKLYLLALSKISFYANNFVQELIHKDCVDEKMVQDIKNAFVRKITGES